MMKEMQSTSFPPQRQSPIGIWVEILYSLQKMIKAFWPMIIYLFFSLKETSLQHKLFGLALLLLFNLIWGYLKYRNFMFSIDEDREEFIVESGVLNKKRTVLQLKMIQQVSISQSFIQKLVGVYGIEIETAGSTKNEVSIKAVSNDQAVKIKERLLKDTVPEKTNEDPAKPIPTHALSIKISLWNLFKTGITAHYIESAGLIIAFTSTAFGQLKDIGWIEKGAENYMTPLLSSALWQWGLISILVLALLVVILNMIRFMLVYFDFNLSENQRSLLLSYGLFNTKTTIINPKTVQIVRISSNYFQKKLNVFQLSIHQSSSDIEQDKKANVQIPGVNKIQVDDILALIYGKDPQKGQAYIPSIRMLTVPFLWVLLPPILAYGMVTLFYAELYMYLYWIFPYMALALLALYFSFKSYRIFIHENLLMKQSGIWDIKTEIIEVHKIQAVRTQQKRWHRKAGIGHLTLYTAGGSLQFKFLDYSLIQRQANSWLFQVETSKKDWM